MKKTLPLFTILALITFAQNAEAQRPGGGVGGGGPGGGRLGGPPPGLNQGNPNIQNQQFGNRFGNPNAANQDVANQNLGNQNAANPNMPSVAEMAQMMIANFDTNASGGLEQAELQSALTALRQMMQNRNNGKNQGQANEQGNAANAPNQFQRGVFGQKNPAVDGNALGRPPRGGRHER